jgi:transglutaminase-like putative cysteine protease
MRKSLIFLIIAACGGANVSAPAAPVAAAPAAPAVDPELADLVKLAKSGPTQEKHPQADAVVALDHVDVTLRKDGTVVEHHKGIIRILDAQRGKERYADPHIAYDSKRQTLTVQVARTVNRDGSVQVAGKDEIIDIVPPAVADATVYSGVLERVVSFPGVDKGSVVELEYTLTTQATNDSALGGELHLALANPILRREITLTAPEGTTPRFQVVGATLVPTESSADGTHTWTFVAENVPERQPEIGAPSAAAVLPRLVYSFLPDWGAALARVGDRYVPQTVAPEVKAQADKLVAGLKTDVDRASAIYRFVARDIRTVRLPLGWAGYAPNPAADVLAHRYGDDRDKAILFLALCAAEGLSAQAALVRHQVPVLEGVPTLAQFDRLIARVTVGGKEVWVDPADDSGQFGAALAGQDNLTLALAPGARPAARPALDPAASVAQVAASYQLNDKGDLSAQYQFGVTGSFAGAATRTLRALKGENLAHFFQEATARVSAAATDAGHEVGDLTAVSGAIRITHKLRAPAYAPPQGRFQVFQLPPATLGFVEDLPPVGLPKRSDPLWVGTPRTLVADVAVTIPAGWKVAYVPPALAGSAPGITYASKCAAKQGTITCHEEIKLDRMQISPEQYAGFHDAFAKLDDYSQRVVLLNR